MRRKVVAIAALIFVVCYFILGQNFEDEFDCDKILESPHAPRELKSFCEKKTSGKSST
jgi:hypothetical protein